MRPVNKYTVGQKIVLPDGTPHVIRERYCPYQQAKEPLSVNLGLYCVYCEASFSLVRGLDVEHILPKDDNLGYSQLKNDWNNFLLACPTCNGRSNKGNEIALPDDCHYPHLNNTYLSLVYKKGGVVEVNASLTGKSLERANRLIELIGLNKTPVTSSSQDKRWQYRMKQWNLAERYRKRYAADRLDIDCLIDYIKAAGCWSIWFTVFEGYDEVRKRMIEDFPGTAVQCFDPENHYMPVPRNPGKEDPT